MTDIRSFAAALRRFDFGPHKVHHAAAALEQALEGIKHYGDVDAPWTDAERDLGLLGADAGDEHLPARPAAAAACGTGARRSTSTSTPTRRAARAAAT